ncbi:MAG: TonB-dependent receptor plug domain-containing protein [Cytophagales bacterium]|nr:TonB-dependent receptor plug domain-containing protein [Cytophagales bacterium]
MEDDIFALSLEELLTTPIESATKSSTQIQKAPSVVRVFSHNDFEKFRFVTLQDILNTVPGLQVQEYRAGHQLVWIRGVQARYNNKVLLLVDGVPMRESYYGNFNIDEMFPLTSIEKIEILNGPGSVLYGVNSFSGVISITTKKEGKSTSASYGSFNSYSVQGEYDHAGFYANASIFHTEGFSPEYMSDGKQRNVNQNANGQHGLLKYSNENLSILAGIANYTHPYKYRDTKKEYSFDRTPIWGSIRYKKELGEHSTINTHAYTNYYRFTHNKIKYLTSDTSGVKESSTNPLNSVLMDTDKERYSIGMNAIYFLERNVPVNYQTDSDVVVSENANGFVKLDANLAAKFINQRLTINVRVSNLLGAQIYSPPYGGSDGYDVEWAGTTFRVGVSYNFAKK